MLKELSDDQTIQQSGSGWNITNLSAILLAKKLDAFDLSLSRKAARFIIYDGLSKLKTKTDTTLNQGSWI